MNKIWIWTKVGFFGLLFIYIIIFCSTNYANDAKVWVWPNKTFQSHSLTVAVWSFAAGIVATIFVRTTLVTVRQLQDMKERKRAERLHRDVEDMKTKAGLLQPKAPDDNLPKT